MNVCVYINWPSNDQWNFFHFSICVCVCISNFVLFFFVFQLFFYLHCLCEKKFIHSFQPKLCCDDRIHLIFDWKFRILFLFRENFLSETILTHCPVSFFYNKIHLLIFRISGDFCMFFLHWKKVTYIFLYVMVINNFFFIALSIINHIIIEIILSNRCKKNCNISYTRLLNNQIKL